MSLTSGHVPHIALLGATPADLSALPKLPGLGWLSCLRGDKENYEFRRDGDCLFKLSFADATWAFPDLVAIIGKSRDGTLSELAAAWTEKLPAKTVAFKTVADFTPVKVMAAAIELLAEALGAALRQSGRFALDLAAYREEFERLEHNFASLEAYVASADTKAPQEIFAYPVGIESVDLGAGEGRAGPGSRTLKQYLPVNSIGVCGLGLALSSVPPPGSPPLEIALRAIETDMVVGRWMLDPATRIVGWTNLLLDRAVDETALSLVLEIAWTPGHDGWGIELGPPHPNAALCAHTGEGRPFPAPLAMRILGSVPGTTPIGTTDIVLPTGARMALTAMVPKTAYESVTPFGQDMSDDIPLVLYDPESEFIQVHPNGPGKITVAHMTVATPTPSWRLSARTHLAHEKANPTDFALLVLKNGAPLPNMAELAKERRTRSGFSGWQTLTPLQDGSLSALISSTANERLSVYLLTRQKGTHEYAWARFSDLRLHLGPPSRQPRAEAAADCRSTDPKPRHLTKPRSPKAHASKRGKNKRRAPQ